MNILKFLFTRSAVVFLIIILVCIPIVNYQKIKTADQAKLLFFEQPTAYEDLVAYLSELKTVSKEKLRDYIYYLERSREQKPSDEDILHVLGKIYELDGNLVKSQEIYQQGLLKYPKNLWFYYNLAALHFNEKRFDEANKILIQAITVHPEQAASFFKSSQKLLVPIVTQAKIQPGDLKRNIKEIYRDVYSMLVLASYQLHQYEEMRQFAQMALVANVGHRGDFYFYSGLANYLLGEDKVAVENFEKSIEKRSDLAESYEYLAKSLKRLGQQELSNRHLVKAMELYKILPAGTLTERKFSIRVY